MSDLGFHFRIQTLLYSSLQQTNTTQPTYLRFQALERLKGASSSAYLLFFFTTDHEPPPGNHENAAH